MFYRNNDHKKHKEREPRVSSEELNYHIEELSGLLMQPWLSFIRFDKLWRDVENLVSALFKYKRYLTSHAEQTRSRQHSLEPPTHEDNASLITLPGNGTPASPAYISLEQQLHVQNGDIPALVCE